MDSSTGTHMPSPEELAEIDRKRTAHRNRMTARDIARREAREAEDAADLARYRADSREIVRDLVEIYEGEWGETGSPLLIAAREFIGDFSEEVSSQPAPSPDQS